MLLRDITVVGKGYETHEHWNVLIDGTSIAYVGPMLPEHTGHEVYDGTDKIVLPGFYNAHCHIPMTLMRGYGEGLPLNRWLTERMFPFEALMSEEDMYWGAMLGAAELLRSGAVSITDMYMKVPGIVRAVRESGLKANLSCSCTAFAGETYRETEGYRGLCELMDLLEGDDRIRADACIHAEYTSTESVVRDAAAFAAERKLRMHLHLSETEKEHRECMERHGLTPAAYFEQCGVFDVPTTAAHCVWVTDEDCEILARRGVTAAYCPSSNLKLGSGIAPVVRMLEHGVRVAVGTDGAASNNNLNMLEEVTLAALLQRGVQRDPSALGEKELLFLACRAGALSQGRDDCGEISAGMRADLVVYNLDRPHMQPVYHAPANVLFSAQAEDVVLTMVDGKVVYRDGIYPGMDMERILYEARRIRTEKLNVLA